MPLSAPLHKLHNLLCICHIISYFDYQKKVCHLCMFNLRFDDATQKFTFGPQLFVYIVYIWSLSSLVWYYQYFRTYFADRGSLFIYAMPCIYYIMLRRCMLKTLNEMARVHLDLQSTMGTLFCVSVRRAFCCSWLIAIELVVVFYWQITSVDNTYLKKRVIMIPYLTGWHLQLLIQVNSYIWLQSIYVVMNQVFTAKLRYKQRWKMLRNVLRVHSQLRGIQRDISHYCSAYIASVIVLISGCFYMSVIFEAGFDWDLSRLVLMRWELWSIRYLANIFILSGTLLMVVWDYKTERDKFLGGLWNSKGISRRIPSDRKSYRCRYNQTLDIVDMMLLTGNQPRYMICSDVTISEIRIKGESVFNLEFTSLINYIRLLMLSMCLILFVAFSNGFEFSMEKNIFNMNITFNNETDPFGPPPENYTFDSYVLSLALEK